MQATKKELIKAIEQHHDELIETACNRLQKLYGSHYEMIDYECHVEREEMFLNALLDGLRSQTPDSFLVFVDELSEIRSEEGYSLEEFQEAFNVVEDNLWDMLRTEYSGDDALVAMLLLISHVFRQAKDHLSRVYMNKALAAERELEHLRKKFRVYRKTPHHSHLQ